MEETDENCQTRHARKNDMLKMYYNVDGQNQSSVSDGHLDIDSNNFKPEDYLRKLKQEKNLEQLMDTEHDMARQIRTLDSEMQTLVYENYNKFISATDTIRTMKRDFHKMEDEMEKLTANVSSVAKLSSEINSTMHDNRQKILKLSGVHSLLKKLQFLFELPSRLQRCLDMKSYSAAVTYYTKTRSVLSRYQHMESFSGIQRDCTEIMNQVIEKLKDTFHNKNSTPQQLAQCVGLLLRLGEPPASLCDDYLQHTKRKLLEDLEELESYLSCNFLTSSSITRSSTKTTIVAEDSKSIGNTNEETDEHTDDIVEQENTRLLIDVLEFIDRGSNGFLSNLSLTIAAYENLFVNQTKNIPETLFQEIAESSSMSEIQEDMSRVASDKLTVFVNEQLKHYFTLVEKRLDFEKESSDNALLVRALDRFYRRLQATRNLLPSVDVMTPSCNIVIKSAKSRCEHYNTALRQYFSDCLTDARHIIAASKTSGGKSTSFNMLDLLNTTASSILNQIKSVLADVQLFTARDINFSSNPFFNKEFPAKWVREEIIVNFIHDFCKVMEGFCSPNKSPGGKSPSPPPALLLLLSRLCKDFELSTVAYVLTLTDEQFAISERDKVTSAADLTSQVGLIAQRILECYVKQCGQSVSKMLRTSVETRDWARSVEPRQVRAVMRRVVEEITQIDVQVGSLYEEGLRKARSSDSSKRTFQHPTSTSRQRDRGHWGNYAQSSNMDNSLMSNIQKLFSERVDVFGPVEFSKMSVLTSVVKIALKTLLECVRLRTFGKFGLQQLQVDCHYLQMYLWRFVSDENIVHCMLDEVISSGIHRCIDPVRMEQSVIEVICERG
uniref:vacuolar protein sorting-associated protein 51 homolog n=1 Tax=Styela clava TaxID=7725 RepID=UPI00193A43AF|nr:vacuolar protein sorting-associated protein 51 homolog [Styela clava]